MSIQVVCGINWGDEGKGRMVDYLAKDANIVSRYQGGNNAGHTVVNEHGEFKLHLIPSGIFHSDVTNVLGPGMVIDIQALTEEIDEVRSAGIPVENLKISDRATILFPYHRMEDGWEEERLSKNAFGSTKRGIAPAYGDRYLKKCIQIGELFFPDILKERLRPIIEWKNLIAKGVYGKENALDFDEVFNWVMEYGEKIKPMICDTTEFFENATKDGKTILFEAQLGALRDICYGIYPFTSSSSPLAAFAPLGSGCFSSQQCRVIGVMKAFSTCVGAGPFVTELDGDAAHELREHAGEYGAATGRPRRIGHFDALASRYGAVVQGATDIAITKLDSLSGRKSLSICTHYEYEGKRIDSFPLNAVLDRAKPVYIDMPGWDEDITSVRKFEDLPKTAQEYVLKIEELVERPISFVSVGPEREALIVR